MSIRDEKGRFIKGYIVPEEIREKNSESHKGHIPWNKGVTGYHTKLHTEEHNKKISNALKGKKPSPEAITKRAAAYKGKHFSQKTEFQKGHVSPNKGKKGHQGYWKDKRLSKETKDKISVSKKANQARGENSSHWQGGISFEPYCPKFNKQLKEAIRERDNGTCQLCGIKENGKRLSVHHIHYDKENCKPDLISLCNACNSKVNYNRDYWESYFIAKLKDKGHLIE